MTESCTGKFETGKETLDKVRMMGFSKQYLAMPLNIECEECNKEFEMLTHEDKCPHCDMIYAVTPCHAFDADNVKAAGKEN